MRLQQQESIPGNDFGSTLRVLVAEQEQAVRDALVERVHDALGVQADAVNTASAVRKLLNTHAGEFVLAVVDTRLPDAPEGEVLEPLISNQVPTIAISSRVTEEVAARLQDRHIIDCVLKRSDEDTELIADLVTRTLLNHQRKILFYSSNDFNRKIIRQLLDIHRYTVIDVRTEADVRRQLDTNRDISLLLVDHHAIKHDELTLINSLRQYYRREDLSIAAVCELPDHSCTARLLRAGANDVISKPYQPDEFYYRIKQCVESVERVREIKFSATRDSLTGLYNRDYLFDVGEKIYASAQRGDIQLSMAMIEIDDFDNLTTQYGIEVSNEILKTIAPILQNELRKNDVLARYNAGTFVCLASNVGDHNAIMVFERIRQLIAKTPVQYGANVLGISGSIGVSTYPDETFIAMIGNAQEALNQAKEQGHNCVIVTN
ncbi:hypothetical protein AB833_16800 [Chromatiales bacterium (ex Bugula neritina AB1)]|nr:hypothetical protein AB833_16800 [Chromatiales bacterium (ex Bugula neritina AB1)]